MYRSFQFTCPSRSTTKFAVELVLNLLVSIHVPLAEHDPSEHQQNQQVQAVSIHVPLAEHDKPVLAGCLVNLVSIHVPLAEHDMTSFPS